MKKPDIVNEEYNKWFIDLKNKIRSSQIKVALAVNEELLSLYWMLGDAIIDKQQNSQWGDSIIERLAQDLSSEFVEQKGFSRSNLFNVRKWYLFYSQHIEIVQQAVGLLEESKPVSNPKAKYIKVQQAVGLLPKILAGIPWGHHLVIITKCADTEEALFYLQETIINNWSRHILRHQIEIDLYHRQGKSLNNFELTLPKPFSDLARETIKNPLIFDFLDFGSEMQERELEKELIRHIKKFILELGRGFAYVGNQYNLNIEGDDFFLDLLFFNYQLNCFVVFELKVGEFKAEYTGKLNLYVNIVNEKVKSESHNPTIGVLLCKTPNETVIKYALKGIETPMGVSDYEFSKVLPKQLKGEMPSVAELEEEIEKEYQELKSPAEKKLDALKRKLAGIKTEEYKTPATYEIMVDLFKSSLKPLYAELLASIKPIIELFAYERAEWYTYSNNFNSQKLDEIEGKWMDENFMKSNDRLTFRYTMYAFKKFGVDVFNMQFELAIVLEPYIYQIILNNNTSAPVLRKLYHQSILKDDREKIIEEVQNVLINDINRRVEHYENAQKFS